MRIHINTAEMSYWGCYCSVMSRGSELVDGLVLNCWLFRVEVGL